MSNSPIPVGARLVRGGSLPQAKTPHEFAIYELAGSDAISRVRSTAERSGYTVLQVDEGSVTLLRGETRIVARRGHPLEDLITPAGDVSTDEDRNSAVILVLNPVPQWRASLRAY